MTIRTDISKTEWEDFLLSTDNPPFLQSHNMIPMHEGLGQKAWVVGIDDGGLIGGALVIEVRARRGSYLYLPYGPVLKDFSAGFAELTVYLQDYAKEHGFDFVRSSPFIGHTSDSKAVYAAAGWRKAPIHMLAEYIWWLDIAPSEEDLMKGMRKTMRNLIRRADKDGVEVRMTESVDDVEIFIQIHKDTFKRHGFVPYSDDYFREQVKAFLADNEVAIFTAYYEDKPIACSIMMFYGNIASYHHGASLSEYNKIPATYAVQWAAIQEAKRRGCEKYNFWGIVPEDKLISPVRKKPHPFTGVTKFKTGFGGELFPLLPCQDLVRSPSYWLKTWPIETVRKYKRGFF